MINCVIIDDEKYARETLASYIDKTEEFKLTAAYSDSLLALSDLKENIKVDLVFLDIDMPGLSGFEVASLLPVNTAIIYTTAFATYALKAFETNVYDFLLKPVSFVKFLKSTNKVKEMLKSHSANGESGSQKFFFINPGVKGKVTKIAYEDIIYVEGLKNYVVIYVNGSKHITYLSMKEIEAALPATNFLRVHKSYLINLTKIQMVEGNTIILSNQFPVPLGGNYKSEFENFINQHSIISKRKT